MPNLVVNIQQQQRLWLHVQIARIPLSQCNCDPHQPFCQDSCFLRTEHWKQTTDRYIILILSNHSKISGVLSASQPHWSVSARWWDMCDCCEQGASLTRKKKSKHACVSLLQKETLVIHQVTMNRTGPGFLGVLWIWLPTSHPTTVICTVCNIVDLDPGANLVLLAKIAELHIGCT